MRLPLFAVCMLLPLSAFGFDFKGVKIGAPATPEQVQEKLGVKCGAGANAIQVCNGTVTIARETARLNLVINSAGVVGRMHLMLSPEAFDIVAPMLIEKFGSPTKTSHSQLQIWNPSCQSIRTATVRSRWPRTPFANSTSTNQQRIPARFSRRASTATISPAK